MLYRCSGLLINTGVCGLCANVLFHLTMHCVVPGNVHTNPPPPSPQQKGLEILGDGGISKAKNFKEKCINSLYARKTL